MPLPSERLERADSNMSFRSYPFEVGDYVLDLNGSLVKILDGQYWGWSGFTNFWSWSRVLKDGSLDTNVQCGYGWLPRQNYGKIFSTSIFSRL